MSGMGFNNSNMNPFKKFAFTEKNSPLPKPDFSSIEKKEAQFNYKEKGSYKKPKVYIPESPMKSPNQKFFTPVKMQSNLFGNASTCRKLVFSQDHNEANLIQTKKSLLERLEEENKDTMDVEKPKKASLFDRFQSIKMDVDEEEEIGQVGEGIII
jgi:hypothetical protein